MVTCLRRNAMFLARSSLLILKSAFANVLLSLIAKFRNWHKFDRNADQYKYILGTHLIITNRGSVWLNACSRDISITSVSSPLGSLLLQFPTCRKPWFSQRYFVTSPTPLGSPITYWITGWLECVQRPYNWPLAEFFFSLLISRLICFSSPLWIVTVTLIFATTTKNWAEGLQTKN